MVDKLASLLLKIRRLSVFRVFQRTLVMLMPIAIIGAYFKDDAGCSIFTG